MPTSLLGLGSNLGDRASFLSGALEQLQAHPQIELLRQSSFHQTQAIGGPAEQDAYLNAAAVIRTSLSPQELLGACQEIENSLGRIRQDRWGPRTIDLDLLLYDELVLNEPELQIPHPRMAWRRFVLERAAEIATEMVHPVIRWTVGHLLYHLNSTPWYLAIEGPAGSHKESVAAEVARQLGARLLTDPLERSLRPSQCDPSGRKLPIELQLLQRCARVRSSRSHLGIARPGDSQ